MAARPASGVFMRILDDTEIKATVCLNAKAAELFPEAVMQLHPRGHEIAGHSYTQDLVLPYLSPLEEEEVIQRCKRIIESAVGARRSAGLARSLRRPCTRRNCSPKQDSFGMATITTPICPIRLATAKGRARRVRPQRLHRQPHPALQPARFLQRLQRHLRLSPQTRSAVTDQPNGALPTSAAGR